MPSLTHHLIAEHVGTAREVVSAHMSHMRRLGLIRYTRKEIAVYCDAIAEALRSQGVAVNRATLPSRTGVDFGRNPRPD
jgi:hypothetical protein